jgi:peptidoglycan/xylan/chitin deacetylase (PgdA/CDA1 family)
MDRDLVGYGANPPPVQWPDGGRLALSMVLNYEEGSEYSVLDGDAQGESLGEIPSAARPGQRDLDNESFFEYGSRVGVWRILSILEEYQVKASAFCCALALERNPLVGPELVRRQHEIVAHGYRWEEHLGMDYETEREAIRKAVASIVRTTGERPLGWYPRGGRTAHTRQLLVEEGGFLYDSSAYNDDLPYYVQVKDRPWLVIPYTLELNDTKYWRGVLPSPAHFLENLTLAFDRLYQEGATHPRMMSVGLHCRITGKPARAAALQRFLEYARSKPGVWFARRIDIARWWRDRYPPHEQRPGRERPALARPKPE